MTTTPLQDSLKKLRADGMDWVEMQVGSKSARSHSWFKNMTQNGAWGMGGAGRVGPPDRAAIRGLAVLLGTSEPQVAAMVAADFYDVTAGDGYSARIQRLAPVIDGLDENDADLVESVLTRLAR